ncbi:polysaccharide biosynthesis/export family protein [Prochlorococcus sp. AH-716-G10]|nr:polysaccharide biosynthesis/export family protein [Prochlorococcus sp. AH-716-G10]
MFSFLFFFFIFDTTKAETNLSNTKNNQIEIEYLESRNALEDYIIDTGDSIALEFFPAQELSGIFPVNEEGELFLPRIDETFVRGLTTSELKTLLEKRYAEFLIDPEIKVRIALFKSIRVLARGELRNPGLYRFPAYTSLSFLTSDQVNNLLIRDSNKQFQIDQNSKLNNQSSKNLTVKRSSGPVTTLSEVIRKAGGITSTTDLSRIEILRDVPYGKGGGKKRAFIDFNAYINESDTTNDIRIFDGDSLFFHKLSKADANQIPKSILSGVSPKFISVNLFGRIATPGAVKLPLESVLSDAIDLTGPIRPLSGKIVLIRYEKNGKVLKKNISYSARAKKGSKKNPYLKNNDLIAVKNGFLGQTNLVLKEVTAPFIGIFATKEILEGFND